MTFARTHVIYVIHKALGIGTAVALTCKLIVLFLERVYVSTERLELVQ